MVLPNHHDQTPAGYECPADVAKRSDRIAEEHRAVSADRDIEVRRRKAVDLRVAFLEDHVVQLLRFGELTGAREHRRRRVDSQHAPHCRASRRFARRQSGPASDVEDVLIATDVARSAQYLVV